METPLRQRWELAGVEKAEAVMLVWSFTNPNEIPHWVHQREYRPEEYTVRRVSETLQMGGGMDEMTMERGPKKIMDSGRHLAELKFCQGGYTLYEQLLKRGFTISDLWYEVRESEESKAAGRSHIKRRINMVLSKKQPKKEIRPPLNLLKSTWIAHIWDNRLTPHKSFTVHFTFKQRALPDTVITLPT